MLKLIKEESEIKGKRISVSCLVVMVMIALSSTIARADQTDKLIEILKEKGTITGEEAKSLEKEDNGEASEKEAKGEASEKEAEGEASSDDDWTKKIEVGYEKGAYIKTTDGRFSVKLNVRTQGAFSYDVQEDQDNTTTFKVRRARVLLGGNVYYPWMKYFTQITLEGGNASLRDAYIQATYFDWAEPKIGQYKVPFDREFLISGFDLQLIDRSIASDTFSLQRDIGIEISGELLRDQLAYGMGMFNGSGANQNNVNQEFMYVGRVVYTPFGPVPYSQGALDTPATPKLAVGVAGAYLPGLKPGERKTLAGPLGNTNIVPVKSDVYELTADLAFKYQNFSFEGSCDFRSIDPNKSTPYGQEQAQGFYLQGGYFLIPKKFEVAARYAWVDPDNPDQKDDNKQQEYTGGMSYYMHGHQLKMQANYSYFRNQSTSGYLDDHLVQAMITLAF